MITREARKRQRAWTIGALALTASLGGAALTSCTSSTTAITVRSFERAQRMDVVCLRVFDDAGNPVVPVPARVESCSPPVAGLVASQMPFHLFAVVTQSLRGELAVVDLTIGSVVDTTSTTPGTNFLPVGTLPTDVAAAPDGTMVFVGAAEGGKPAIYGIPSVSLLGDSQRLPASAYDAVADAGPLLRPVAPSLPAWPVCSLPQAPGSLAVMPRASTSDAGGNPSDYVVVALLPGNAIDSAKVVTIDPKPFGDGRVGAGSLSACPILSSIELSDAAPATWQAGQAWPDGIPYVDGGVDLFQPLDGGAPSGDGGGDPGLRMPAQAAACDRDGGTADNPLRRTVGTRAHGSSLAVAGSTLYIGDDSLPIVHVLDASNPTAMHEIDPLVVTSTLDATRVVTVKSLAASPVTRDYKRYLYAIDRDGGGLIVYDITDPRSPRRAPLAKPNPELNPFQPPDRLLFTAPVAAVTFARHDFPNTPVGSTSSVTGALCNPNPGADSSDPGLAYRSGGSGPALGLGPARLRGVFAMATLTNGQVVTIDVDDWDAPCRRPTYLDEKPRGNIASGGVLSDGYGDLAIAQTSGSGAYSAPGAVDANGADLSSGEWFFPVSQPHRARSSYMLRNDSTSGRHVPNLLGVPQLYEGAALVGANAKDAVLRPARDVRRADPYKTGAVDLPSGVRLAFDDPEVHVDQDWSVTYEGVLPGFDGLAATLSGSDYQTLTMAVPNVSLCRRGIEDARLGRERAQAIAAESPSALPAGAESRLADYVQITDEVLASTDPYWSLPNGCWEGVPNASTPAQRATLCSQYFGPAAQGSPSRDLPILEAYDDHLVLGQFSYRDPNAPTPSGHAVAPKANSTVMRLAQCCFHNQAHFKVRAGGEWVAVGSATGYLSHLTASPSTGACVQSCVSREALLSSRMLEVQATDVSRNSAMALRNPFFSAWMRSTGTPNSAKAEEAALYTFSQRDAAWRFSVRGGFVPQTINLASSTTAVVPQSMRSIDVLGQVAIVDGSSQGLLLVDLGTVALAHAPYF